MFRIGFGYDRDVRPVMLLVVTAGCRQLLGFENPTVTDATSEGPLDSPTSCAIGASACPASAPVCVDDVCVECSATELGVCAGTQPVCGSDLRCRACESHAECASDVCLASGACADAVAVAYVAAGGTGDECTQMAPCERVALGMATGRAILKVRGTVTDAMSTTLARSVQIYGAADAVITRSSNGQIVSHTAGLVELHGITIANGTSNAGTAIRTDGGVLRLDRVNLVGNGGLGLDVRQATVEISRCIVAGNAGGGLDIENSAFTISNSLIVQNGSASSAIGGARLKPNAGSTFELNTVADNVIQFGPANSAVRCDQPFEAHSNIVVGNQLDTGCTFHDSLFDNVNGAAMGNIAGDPDFLDTTTPASPTFYRIGDASAAIDKGVSTLTIDIDGEPRPAGAATDMGADEAR